MARRAVPTTKELERENRRLRAALAAADATIREMQQAFVEMAALREEQRAEETRRAWDATTRVSAAWRPWDRWAG